MKDNNVVNEKIVRDIANAVKGLEYGAILIKIHNSKITQIEVTERKRFDNVCQNGDGGGI